MERVSLLVCDLDGTLLGDDAALDEFAAWFARDKRRWRLAYSSGRFVASVFHSIEASNLPEPDAVMGGVGTEIFDVAADCRVAAWPPAPAAWDPRVIRAICQSHPALTPQPHEFVSRHKISFYGIALSVEFLNRLTRQLAAAGQDVAVVYSSDRDLDVVPRGVDKGAAARFLARSWGIAARCVVVAGDSGNDATMFQQGFRGIVVGNALPELRALAGPHVYHAAAPFAAGVLEGLAYWGAIDAADRPTGDPSIAAPSASHGMHG